MYDILIFNEKHQEVLNIERQSFLLLSDAEKIIKAINNKYSEDEKYWSIACLLNRHSQFDLDRDSIENLL